MTLTHEIKNNPYLKVRNCTDKSDLEFGMSECARLEKKYGQSKTLDIIFNRMFKKKRKL